MRKECGVVFSAPLPELPGVVLAQQFRPVPPCTLVGVMDNAETGIIMKPMLLTAPFFKALIAFNALFWPCLQQRITECCCPLVGQADID